MNLDKKIFGNITIKEIIGAEPPIENIQIILENQLDSLLNDLESYNTTELQNMLNDQILAEKEINSKLGAMALAQNKIKIFIEFNQQLIQTINAKLES